MPWTFDCGQYTADPNLPGLIQNPPANSFYSALRNWIDAGAHPEQIPKRFLKEEVRDALTAGLSPANAGKVPQDYCDIFREFAEQEIQNLVGLVGQRTIEQLLADGDFLKFLAGYVFLVIKDEANKEQLYAIPPALLLRCHISDPFSSQIFSQLLREACSVVGRDAINIERAAQFRVGDPDEFLGSTYSRRGLVIMGGAR